MVVYHLFSIIINRCKMSLKGEFLFVIKKAEAVASALKIFIIYVRHTDLHQNHNC